MTGRRGDARAMGLLTALLLASLLVGCGGMRNHANALRESTTDFARAMRWGQLEQAALHVPDASRAEFIRQKRVARMQMQIHDYEIRTVDHELGSEKARVVVAALWSRAADPVTHEDVFEQDWRWQRTHWVLVRQVPLQAATPGPPVQPSDGL